MFLGLELVIKNYLFVGCELGGAVESVAEQLEIEFELFGRVVGFGGFFCACGLSSLIEAFLLRFSPHGRFGS